MNTSPPPPNGGDRHVDPEAGRRHLGGQLLELSMLAVVLFIVIQAFVYPREKVAFGDQLILLAAAALFLAVPQLMGWLEGRKRAPDAEHQTFHHAPSQLQRAFYLFLFIPSGLLFVYGAIAVGRDGFLAMIPVFVMAGYGSTLFPLLGSMASTVYLLALLQLMLITQFQFAFNVANLVSMAAGALVFNAIFLITGSAERARLHSARLAAELEDKNKQLRDYALRVEDLAVTEERNRLAREIHDSIGHALTVVNIQMEAARTVFDSDPAKARASLEAAQAYTRQGLKEIRLAVNALRDDSLVQRSLEASINALIEQARQNGLAAELRLSGDIRPLSSALEHTVLRAVQEALTNTLRHASAQSFSVDLAFHSEQVELVISDDGVGAEPAQLKGFGLLGLRERVGHHGGDSRIETRLGHGFAIHLTLPTPSPSLR